MRYAITLVLVLVLSSCANKVKRQAHFLPLYENKVLYSGEARLIDHKRPVGYLTPSTTRSPANLEVLRLADGSLRVSWVCSRNRHLRLMYVDSGLHPVVIPEVVIRESSDINADIDVEEPYVLRGFGPNSAFIRGDLDLRPRQE